MSLVFVDFDFLFSFIAIRFTNRIKYLNFLS